MLEQDSGQKNHQQFAVASARELNLSQTNDPQEGALLVRAFLRIADAEVFRRPPSRQSFLGAWSRVSTTGDKKRVDAAIADHAKRDKRAG